MAERAQPTEETPGLSEDLRATGERIETLLEASSTAGPLARERAEELVRLVVDLYGAGLERLLDITHDAGRLDAQLCDALAADDLVASLLLVHGLHPYDVTTRVSKALDSVRPYLGSHGGDVELLDVSADGVVRLRLLGSCDGCPSSSATLTLAVEGAVQAAAPEVVAIEVEESTPSPATGSVIPVEALRVRTREADPALASGDWRAVPELETLAAGEIRGLEVGGLAIVAARVGAERYAYRDRCPRCTGSLADGVLQRRAGGVAGDVLLRCPTCRSHYDVRRAGASVEPDGDHLEPLPLLGRDGSLQIAVPSPLPGG